jgi:hypothetical protein
MVQNQPLAPVLQEVPTGPMQTQPAITIGGSLSAILFAVFAILKAQGVEVTEEMTDGIEALIYALCAIPAVAGVITRFFVFAPATVVKEANRQYLAGVPPTEPQPEVPPPAQV